MLFHSNCRHPGLLLCSLLIGLTGCVKTQTVNRPPAFEPRELDACLAIVIDQTGSFHEDWEQGGYDLFLAISERFFSQSMGSETRLVIAQLSGNENTILFEGHPADLRKRFASPEELHEYLRANSDSGSSPVYSAAKRTTDYVLAMPGVSKDTRILTVYFSDMLDNSGDQQQRSQNGRRMLASLTRYRESGGALALYYVDPKETSRWKLIVDQAGFEPGSYVIESSLVERPQLPSFD